MQRRSAFDQTATRHDVEARKFELDRSTALLAGALAVADLADKRHLLLLARREMAHRSGIADIDALIEDALAAPVEADTSTLFGLARTMLTEAAERLDATMAA